MSDIDEIKDAILEYMNEESLRFPHLWHSASTIGIRVANIKKYNNREVERAVNFLGEEGLLSKRTENHQLLYRLSSKGSQKFSPSKYAQSISHINITQSGGVSIIGAGNSIGTVNQTTISTINELDKVTNLINNSNIDENKKRDAILDIESIKNQIIKTEPDKSFIKTTWDRIVATSKMANNAGEIVKALTAIYSIIKHLVPDLQSLPPHDTFLA